MFTKNNDKDGSLGQALSFLFEQTTTLGELAITGNESNGTYIDNGLELLKYYKITFDEFQKFIKITSIDFKKQYTTKIKNIVKKFYETL